MILLGRLTYAFKQVSQSVVKAGGIPCGRLASSPGESTRQLQESSQKQNRLGVGGALVSNPLRPRISSLSVSFQCQRSTWSKYYHTGKFFIAIFSGSRKRWDALRPSDLGPKMRYLIVWGVPMQPLINFIELQLYTLYGFLNSTSAKITSNSSRKIQRISLSIAFKSCINNRKSNSNAPSKKTT